MAARNNRSSMDGYKSLIAWQAARDLNMATLEATDQRLPARTWAVVDQLRRATISADVNIVEGYALGTKPQFRRHLKIALGSAAESERLIEIALERGYLPQDVVATLHSLANRAVRTIYGLARSPRLPEFKLPKHPPPT